ncbi:hypothetical protein [Solimicrobium silvestre]|uniref:Uncharacterized protein n=1 Tax=Solimicrobium silvestre TaxID=2099400 RepID=A0A2S9GYJ7_9BURK|nr:hypothetical protein [Solimicrobium silvestre]PRC92794.1 hypothetical protein S2091_2524 [Solimicrobium silvestre]
MSDVKKNDVENKDEKDAGLDVTKVTFDKNGEVTGLSDEVLDSVSGGLKSVNNSCTNSGC